MKKTGPNGGATRAPAKPRPKDTIGTGRVRRRSAPKVGAVQATDASDEAAASGASIDFAYPDPTDTVADQDATGTSAAASVEERASGRRGGWRGIRQADGLVEPTRLLAELVLDPLLTRPLRRALAGERPVVVVLIVPSAGWVKPVEACIVGASVGRARILVRAVRPRASAEAELDAEAADRIASGRPLVAIAPDARFLAPVLLAAADHTLILPPLDASLVTRAVGLWCGRRPCAALAAADLSGLDLLDVAAALRTDATPAACLKRIRRASRARSSVPLVDPGLPAFAALTGYGEALDWAQRTVADIARVRRGEIGAAMLESVVWHGPPGTGKTTLARAMAAAAGVTVVETSVAQWFVDSPGFLDSILKQISAFAADLEQAARRDGTALGYLDELDALPSRTRLDARSASWWQPVVVHMLTIVEQLRRAGVVLVAATNHIEHLDPALLRPGRFDRQMLIGPPDEAGRIGILRTHLGQDLADCDLAPAARLSGGMTGAVLAGHVRGARNRARAAGRDLQFDDLLAEIAPAEIRSAAELHAVSLHEAGHSVVALRLGLRVEQVSIQAGTGYGGRTHVQLPDGMPDRAMLERRVLGLLAGRAADAVVGAGVSAGAASDLREATRQLAAMQACLGLGTRLSALVEPDQAGLLLRDDPALAAQVEADLRRLQAVAEQMVRADRAAITALAEALLVRRVMTGAEIAAIAAAHRPRLRVPAAWERRDAPGVGSPAQDPGAGPAAPA